MAKKTAGILLYRWKNKSLEVLLAHHGGPFWTTKDLGTWTIPKGEVNEEEDIFEAAKREFKEETGMQKHLDGEFIPLFPLKQKSGKTIYAWALEGDFDVGELKSNTFEMELPPKSGIMKTFPEIDMADWFDIATAKEKILPGQLPFIDELVKLLP
jgi:predicted NUDIX family NTP pyrophosphohydrolase